MCEALEEFKQQAFNTSFHYADDSAKEWGLARKCKAVCKKLYEEHPDLRNEMDNFMTTQLWGREFTQDIAIPIKERQEELDFSMNRNGER